MANTNNTRRTHSSPGVYFKETEITYSNKSLGITTLGVAGEALRGPAFQPITIESWRDYQNYFGGTSTEKYRGSQYPKYELPYIAKSYLEQSEQLEVVRVLGLSGVNAGPAWVLTATKNVLGTKNVYGKLAYAPSEVTESEWVWSGTGQNSFKIGETIPSYITTPTSTSPNYYKQVTGYERPEFDCSKISSTYDWNGRLFDTVEIMYADTTLVDGYAKVTSGLGYEYTLMSTVPTGTTWTKGTNWFCELPAAEVTSTSPSPIKVGCNYAYQNMDDAKQVKLVTTSAPSTYLGDVVIYYDDGDYIAYTWSTNSYSSEGKMTDLDDKITVNNVVYDVIEAVDVEDSSIRKMYVWDADANYVDYNYNFTENYNWFNNTEFVSQETESTTPTYVKVNESEYVDVVSAVTLYSTTNASAFYIGDIAYYKTVNDTYVCRWDNSEKKYVQDSYVITSLTRRILVNETYYDFLYIETNYYYWNGTGYSQATSNTDITTNLGEYIKLIDSNQSKVVYKWNGSNGYALISYVNGASCSTEAEWNSTTSRPNLENYVIPYNTYEQGKPNINSLYNYNEIQKYNLGENLPASEIPTVYTTYYVKEDDRTGGAKDAILLKSDIDTNPDLGNAKICTPQYALSSTVPSEATDLGYTKNVLGQIVQSLAVDKGEYVSLNTEIQYVGTDALTAFTTPIVIGVNSSSPHVYTKIQKHSTTGYALSDLTEAEKNDANAYQYTDWSSSSGGFLNVSDGFEADVNSSCYIPLAIKVGTGYFKLKNIPQYFKRECSATYEYYAAKPLSKYSIIVTKESEYYKNVESVEYYQRTNVTKCYEVKPICNYYKKEVVSYQTEEEDTECCEANLNTVVGVLRSRGEHKKAKFIRTPNAQDKANGICNDIYEYDGVEYYAKEVKLEPIKSMTLGDDCNPGFSATSGDFTIDSTNYGRFTIVVTTIDDEVKRYPVSLNPTDRNYIYNVIGGNPEDGESEVYVEELYDVALKQMIEEGKANAINGQLTYFPPVYIMPSLPSVDDILTLNAPTRKELGKRYLFSTSLSNGIEVLYYEESKEEYTDYKAGVNGVIYTVEKVEDKYAYVCHCQSYNTSTSKPTQPKESITVFNYCSDVNEYGEITNAVKVLADDMFYIGVNTSETTEDVAPVTFDMNNYREPFRYSSTPWILSEMKGDAENVELTKLFRFHTISDGSNSVDEVKISIENIDPEYGTFDVVIRDFNDSDYSQTILEKYTKCNLVPGSKNYIALKIGSFDGSYEPKSKYVTVEVNETDITEVSTPAGFMGYPVRDYSGIGVAPAQKKYVAIESLPTGKSATTVTEVPSYPGCDAPEYIKCGEIYYHLVDAFSTSLKKPWFKYNTEVDEDVRARKQYFGISDIVGIDTDILKYKGVEAYNGVPDGMSACFHLDSRILNGTPDENCKITEYGISQKVSIDGICGYSWVTVGSNNTTDEGIEPRIGDYATMLGTIYEDIKYRKFTVAMYGGWDGWDYYRTSRSNTNDFTYSNYRGTVNKTSGFGNTVNVLKEPEAFGLEAGTKCLNTDYYAYLGAIKQFANPRTIEINVLATPGIDYVNNNLLVEDVIEMVEEERADALYVVTTPDKPFGAGDSQSEMYSAEDAVYNLEGSDIDSNRVCTYYPWEKYYDDTNYQYIFLPITRDVVKSIAYTDNITHPWYAPAGWNRGSISGVAPRKKLKVSETDTLYDGRINYVNSFAKEGDKIWGNKNLQIAESQMNRISTRRLLLRIKKLCDKACIGFIFDPNDSSMGKSLESALKSILDNIKSNRGIYDYKIEIDTSVEARERLELPATIYIKPTKLVEYLTINCVVTPEGMDWN